MRGGAGGEGSQSLRKRTNPYRGLMAMIGANAEYFLARERETATILSTLAGKPGRLPLLLGASRVGESSVAQTIEASPAMVLSPMQ